MELDHGKINKLYWQDTGLVSFFIIFVWGVLGYVLITVRSLTKSILIKDTAVATGLIAGIFVTSALVAVLVHIKKNKIALYREEVEQLARQIDTNRPA
jgi:hypothetical protein